MNIIYPLLAGQTEAMNRIYPGLMPQDCEEPAIVYTQVSGGPMVHGFGADGDVQRIRYQVDCWAPYYAQAKSLAGQVKSLLSRRSGNVNGAIVHDVLLNNEMEGYEEGSYRIILDFTIYAS